ncbi:MAG: fumarylacetoacetate hydrolase family protein [candidate division NC10 bacterium]|nr:fumarylacetoacetate hydrolase family protein [candidate division NC10 bacterium]
MKLVQFFLPGRGRRVGVVQGERVLDITAAGEGIRSTLDLIVQGKTPAGLLARATWLARRARARPLDWSGLQRAASRRVPHLLLPLEPPEVWGVDGTYGPGVFPPPAVFFKATGERCVGPGFPLIVRTDSGRIVPEAELAVVIGADGHPLAFAACNDLTDAVALHDGPSGMAAAKVLRGGCALGPCLVTPDEIGDPDRLQVRCAIRRGGVELFAAVANTAQIASGVAGLVTRLLADGWVPPGTVLATGSGIWIPESVRISDGDHVDVEIEGIGRLSNPVKVSPRGTRATEGGPSR